MRVNRLGLRRVGEPQILARARRSLLGLGFMPESFSIRLPGCEDSTFSNLSVVEERNVEPRWRLFSPDGPLDGEEVATVDLLGRVVRILREFEVPHDRPPDVVPGPDDEPTRPIKLPVGSS